MLHVLDTIDCTLKIVNASWHTLEKYPVAHFTKRQDSSRTDWTVNGSKEYVSTHTVADLAVAAQRMS